MKYYQNFILNFSTLIRNFFFAIIRVSTSPIFTSAFFDRRIENLARKIDRKRASGEHIIKKYNKIKPPHNAAQINAQTGERVHTRAKLPITLHLLY